MRAFAVTVLPLTVLLSLARLCACAGRDDVAWPDAGMTPDAPPAAPLDAYRAPEPMPEAGPMPLPDEWWRAVGCPDPCRPSPLAK